MFVSGHVFPQVDQHNWGTSFAERPLLFHNIEHGKRFEMIPAVEGTGLADVIPARGAAFGDLFNDGKIDVVINCMDHTPVLLRNVNADTQPLGGAEAHRRSEEPARCNRSHCLLDSRRDAATRRCDERRQLRIVKRSGLHFGLGDSDYGRQASRFAGQTAPWSTSTCRAWIAFFAIEEGKGIVPSVYDGIAAERNRARKLPARPRGK